MTLAHCIHTLAFTHAHSLTHTFTHLSLEVDYHPRKQTLPQTHKDTHTHNIQPRPTLPQPMCTVALNNLTAPAMQGYFTTIYTCTQTHTFTVRYKFSEGLYLSHTYTRYVWLRNYTNCPWDHLLKSSACNLSAYKQHNYMYMHLRISVCFLLWLSLG